MMASGGKRMSRKGSSGGCWAARKPKSSSVRIVSFILVHPGRPLAYGLAVLQALVSDSKAVCREFPEETRSVTTKLQAGSGPHPLSGGFARQKSRPCKARVLQQEQSAESSRGAKRQSPRPRSGQMAERQFDLLR